MACGIVRSITFILITLSCDGVLPLMADSTLASDSLLYTPASPERSKVFQFLKHINARYSVTLASYFDLYKWSTANIDKFWSEVWDETDVIGEKGKHIVDISVLPPANPAWFSDAKLNYAENMLRCRSTQKVALIEASMSLTCIIQSRISGNICVS